MKSRRIPRGMCARCVTDWMYSLNRLLAPRSSTFK